MNRLRLIIAFLLGVVGATGQTTRAQCLDKLQDLPIRAEAFAFQGSIGIFGDKDANRAVVYEFDGELWRLIQVLEPEVPTEGFGESVDIDGDWIVVGSFDVDHYGWSVSAANDIYRYDGTAWQHEARLETGDPKIDAHLGRSVALDGNRLALSAYRSEFKTPMLDEVYIFEFDGLTWNLGHRLDTQRRDGFGWSVQLDGDTLVVSAPRNSPGSVFVFEKMGLDWELVQEIEPPYTSHFGRGISLVGDELAIGMAWTGPELVLIYRRQSGLWEEVARLGEELDYQHVMFGHSVALGSRVAAGATDRGSIPSVAVFRELDGRWRHWASFEGESSHNEWPRFVGIDHEMLFIGMPEQGKTEVWLLDGPISKWENYGNGWPGTMGIPGLSFSPEASLDIENSLGFPTVGFMLIGLSDAEIPTSRGGTLLVAPLSFIPLLLPGAGLSVHAPLCSFEELNVYFQVLTLDPGATHGVSFTPGVVLSFL